jgi:hypothetical protein
MEILCLEFQKMHMHKVLCYQYTSLLQCSCYASKTYFYALQKLLAYFLTLILLTISHLLFNSFLLNHHLLEITLGIPRNPYSCWSSVA